MPSCLNSAASSTLSFACSQKLVRTNHTAHFHAFYQEEVGIFSIDPVELIAGSLPKRQKRLVEAWAELHQQELLADWKTLQEGRTPAPIDPLK